MREYLSVVHGQVLSAFQESFTLLRFFLQQYQAGLEEIDQIPSIAVIEDEYLDNYYQEATDAAGGYYDVTNRLSTFYSAYSEYLDGSPPSSSEILDDLEYAADLAKNQREDMEQHWCLMRREKPLYL